MNVLKSMNSRQKLAIIGLPLVVASMLPVFYLTGRCFGPERGWYAGFLVYWPLWCVLFPCAVLGPRSIARLFRPTRMSCVAWGLVACPPIVSLAGRVFTTGASSSFLLWLLIALVNGTLEEVLWRGVTTTLFPASFLWGVVWPSVWFGIWHLAPGMLSLPSHVWQLVAGSLLLGLALGWVAHRTRSILWTVLSHVLAGVAQA